MRHKKAGFPIGFLLLAFFSMLLSCAANEAHLLIENSLPQNELAYYSDSFDMLREDLWNKAGYIHLDQQMQNFKLADMRIENGKLVVQTKTGSFSKGGLAARYAFRGDFDVQLDCRIDFLKGESGLDQFMNVLVIDKSGAVDKSGKISKLTAVLINLYMRDSSFQAWIGSNGFINGRWIKGSRQKIENFNGTLRIQRTGKNFTTLYQNKGAPGWNKIDTFHLNANDMVFGFQVRNYFNNRTYIWGTNPISAEFDNFRINAAHEIIEEEI
jgi:hypothetical protein